MYPVWWYDGLNIKHSYLGGLNKGILVLIIFESCVMVSNNVTEELTKGEAREEDVSMFMPMLWIREDRVKGGHARARK